MDITQLLFPLLIAALFIPIFLSGRKQRRQLADMQALQASLEVGDVVMTTSGLRATVVDASYEETIDLEIADGVVTTWVRAAVREKVLPTGTEGVEDTDVVEEAGPVAPDDASALHGSTVDRPSTDTPSLEKLDKGDSANGSART